MGRGAENHWGRPEVLSPASRSPRANGTARLPTLFILCLTHPSCCQGCPLAREATEAQVSSKDPSGGPRAQPCCVQASWRSGPGPGEGSAGDGGQAGPLEAPAESSSRKSCSGSLQQVGSGGGAQIQPPSHSSSCLNSEKRRGHTQRPWWSRPPNPPEDELESRGGSRAEAVDLGLGASFLPGRRSCWREASLLSPSGPLCAGRVWHRGVRQGSLEETVPGLPPRALFLSQLAREGRTSESSVLNYLQQARPVRLRG